jgi:hypothetical protein
MWGATDISVVEGVAETIIVTQESKYLESLSRWEAHGASANFMQ